MSDCIGPINIIPDNNQVVLLDNNRSITVIDNNCCTNVDITQPITSVIQVSTGPVGPIGPSGSHGPPGSSAPFTYVSGTIWNTTSSIEITGSFVISGSNTFRNIGLAEFTGSVNILGNQTISGSIYLGSGSIINESGSTIAISPPGALPGQSLTIRPTVSTWSITSSGFIVYGAPITISINCLGNTGGLGVGYFGTLNYEITGTGVTQQSLGRPLIGQATFQQGQAVEDIIWTIPSNSSITDFTLTVTSVAGTYLSAGPGYSGSTTLYYNFESNGLPNGQYITVTNNGANNSEHSHVHLVSGDPITVDLYLGDDDQYIKIEKNAGNVVIGTNLDTHQWIFDTSGSLTAPGNITATAFTGSLNGTASWAENALTASYVTSLYQDILISGSLKLDPTQDPDPLGLDLDSTVLFQSSSNTALGYDLYVRQNGNLVKWKWIEGILETGLLYGGVVTYSGSNVFISPGSGIIVDHNATTGSEVSPMVEYVTWNAITQSITNIATQQVTYLYIDNNGALQQQSTRFTSQQYHSYIPLGAVGHFDYIQISAFGGGVQTAYDQISQISNFVDAFGPLKISGYGLTGQAGSLRLSVGSGTSFIHGGFYQNDPEFPSQITTPSQATASLARVQRSGSAIEFDTNAGNLYTVVDPTQYDRDGDGVLHSVGSGNWSIQRVFTDPKTGVLYVYYGQARYTSLLNALQYLPTDPFTEGDTFDFTTFVGFLVLKGNASDITVTTANSIINGGLFRGSGQGSGGGIALSNLDDLTDVSITGPVNGEALIYNAGIWQNGTPTSASYTLTSSFAQSGNGSFSGSFSGSFVGDGSALTGIVSSKWSGSNPITRESNVEITGSLKVTQGITGSLLGTASFAIDATTQTAGDNSTKIATTAFVTSAVDDIDYLLVYSFRSTYNY